MTCNPPDPRTTPVESNTQRFGELNQYSIPVEYRWCQQAHGVSSRIYKINIQKPTNYTVTNGILGSHSEKNQYVAATGALSRLSESGRGRILRVPVRASTTGSIDRIL